MDNKNGFEKKICQFKQKKGRLFMKEMLYINRKFISGEEKPTFDLFINNEENVLHLEPDGVYYENQISFRDPQNKYATRFDCGYSFAPYGYSVINRCKRELILKYILEGTLHYNGMVMTAGDVIFLEPYYCNTILWDETDVKSMWCSWDGDIMLHVAQMLRNYRSDVVYHLGLGDAVRELFEYTIYNRNYGLLDMNKYITGFTEMLLSYLTVLEDRNTHKPSSRIVKRALTEIEQGYDKLTVEKLAGLLYVDSKYLSRIFKQEVGVSPKQYITDRKLTYAEYYLSNSDDPMQKISERVGYSNYTNFYLAFRKKYGMSPEEYRQYCSEERKD